MSNPSHDAVRVFLDANILYAAAIGGGCAKLWRINEVVLVTSEYAAEEARYNLAKHKGKEAVERLFDLLQGVEIHPYEPTRPLFCAWDLPDPNDIPILVGAIESKCSYLITADVACFKEYFGRTLDGVTVIQAGNFLRLYGQ